MLLDKSVPHHVGVGACPFSLSKAIWSQRSKISIQFSCWFLSMGNGFPRKGWEQSDQKLFPILSADKFQQSAYPIDMWHLPYHCCQLPSPRNETEGPQLKEKEVELQLFSGCRRCCYNHHILFFLSLTSNKLNSSRNTAFTSNHCIHNEYGTRLWRTPVRQTTLNEYGNTKADECNQFTS